jgi:beta-lactamase superfamily II metal-dependent hydrolase
MCQNDRKRKKDDDNPNPAKRARTRSQTKPARDAEQQAILEATRKQAEALRLRREEALKKQPATPAGNRGDGSLHISFLQMGQGDCCLIATPKGRVIMIDCGSDSRDGEDDEVYNKRVQDSIYSEKFLKNQNEIDLLILTHPDTDHYDKAKVVLKDNVTIHNVYHSAKFADYSAGQTSNWISAKTTAPSFIKAVTHNDGLIQINGKDVPPADTTNTVDRLDGEKGIRIVDEENCKIAILASNVDYLYVKDDSNTTNRGSVVTLIEIFGQKLLICGDATRSTEYYLLKKYGDRLADLSIVQAPHHGSNNTSSSQNFVDKTNPFNVVMSAGKKVQKDHLPSEATIVRYEERQALSKRTEVPDHEIFYWEEGGMSSYSHTNKFTKRAVYITGSNGTFSQRFEKPSN